MDYDMIFTLFSKETTKIFQIVSLDRSSFIKSTLLFLLYKTLSISSDSS